MGETIHIWMSRSHAGWCVLHGKELHEVRRFHIFGPPARSRLRCEDQVPEGGDAIPAAWLEAHGSVRIEGDAAFIIEAT